MKKMVEDLEKAFSDLVQSSYFEVLEVLFGHRFDWETYIDDLDGNGGRGIEVDVASASLRSLVRLCVDLNLEDAYSQYRAARLSSHS